ncbi:MAG: hypothetical protein PHO29_11540 [Acetobacterium sp.]|nr:hypothetical protein [Acetobacterium sp.]
MDGEIIGLDIIDDTPDYTKTKEEEQERFRKAHGIKDKKQNEEPPTVKS